MRITEIRCEQAHWVPPHPTPARGPFNPELLAKAPVITDYVPDDGTSVRDATPSQFSQTEPLYACTVCEAVVRESELEDHVCA